MANSTNKPLRYLATTALLVGSALSACDEPELTHNEPFEVHEPPTGNEPHEPVLEEEEEAVVEVEIPRPNVDGDHFDEDHEGALVPE